MFCSVLWGSRHFKGQFEIALGEVSARRFTTEVKQMTLQNLNLVNPDGLLRYMDVIGTPIPEKDKIRGKILVVYVFCDCLRSNALF